MPFVDGIELAQIIRRDYPMIRVAFLSGYDEFNYAKKAVELRVIKYLMKPVTSEEINSFLTGLKTSLDKEYKEKQDLLIVQEKYEELLPLIGDSFLSSLIHAPEITTYHLNKLSLYKIPVKDHKNFVTCLVSIKQAKTLQLKELEALKVNTNEIFKSVFERAVFKHSLLVADGLVFIISLDTYDKNDIDRLLFEFKESVKEYIQTSLLIGVSEQYETFLDFPSSYVQAKQAHSHAGRYHFTNVVYFDELRDMETNKVVISLKDYALFDELLHYGNKDALKEHIQKLKTKITSATPRVRIEQIQIELTHLIMFLASKAEVSMLEISDTDFINDFQICNTVEEAFVLFENLVLEIRDNDIRKQLSRSEKLIQKAIRFIEENYTDSDLTLESLSEYLNVSISHLSMLFKKYNGTNFSNYLINLRMQKAKELLKNSNMKIIDIATMCGYSDVYYFSHSFKKYSGTSPRKYRNNEMV